MDVSKTDLNLLVTLDALLDEQSVSRAAKRLFLTQPAVSAALARLRKLLNDPVLVRHGSRMVMTSRARALRAPVREILASIERTFEPPTPFDPGRSTRTFRIATTDYAELTVFPQLMRRLRRAGPDLQVELWALDDRVDERLADGSLDMVVADDWSIRHLKRRSRLFLERFTCLVRRGHPRVGKRMTTRRFLAERHALVSSRGRVPGVVDFALDAIGHVREVALTIPHFMAVPAIVAETDLIVTLPSRVASYFGSWTSVRALKPPVDIPGFHLSLATHRRSDGDAGIAWVTSELVAACG